MNPNRARQSFRLALLRPGGLRIEAFLGIVLLSAANHACRAPGGAWLTPPALREVQGTLHDANANGQRGIEAMAASDPLAFLKSCRQHYFEAVTDYRCHFHMRERKDDRLPDEQVIDVEFREQPFSVDMRWLQNAPGAKRISFVADRWVRNGRQLALIVPSGLPALLVPGGIRLDIHGPEVRAASPRSIDQFGFLKTLERIIENCGNAKDDPNYELRYLGLGELDGRTSMVLERRLPYTGPEGPFPDRLAIISIDREWLVPTGVWSYADEQREQLLGSFVTTNMEFNVGLSDAEFE